MGNLWQIIVPCTIIELACKDLNTTLWEDTPLPLAVLFLEFIQYLKLTDQVIGFQELGLFQQTFLQISLEKIQLNLLATTKPKEEIKCWQVVNESIMVQL